MRVAVLLAAIPAVFMAQPVMENLIVRDTLPPWLGQTSYPIAARDMEPGVGIFGYCTGQPTLEGCRWPVIAVGQSGAIHMACLDSTGTQLLYSRCDPWCTWTEPIRLAPPQPDPGFPTHNITASKTSNKVCVTWVYVDGDPDPGFYRISSDAGRTWGNPEELPWPPAYGGDTATSFHVSSLFPFYENDDLLHIVACVHPRVNDTDYVMPAEIWHWCPNNTPNWSRIHRAGCAPEHLLAPVGYNALYAGRPSIGADEWGNLYVVWEQFDSLNVEHTTNRLRSNLMIGWSWDGGCTWYEPRQLAAGSYGSCRFPSIGDGEPDSFYVRYLHDRTAGFFVLGEGDGTNNPVVAILVGVSMSGPRPSRSDTVGGTTYDLQHVGPTVKTVSSHAPYGVHVGWAYSASISNQFLDLNMRYNFYDYMGNYWEWIDPDFMQSGVNIFVQRTLGGSLDADPPTGVAVVCGTTPPPSGTEHSSRNRLPPPLSATVVRGVLFLPCRSDFPVANRGKDAAPTFLLDATGRKVMTLAPGPNDVRHLPPGIYFVQMQFGEYRETRKLLLVE